MANQLLPSCSNKHLCKQRMGASRSGSLAVALLMSRLTPRSKGNQDGIFGFARWALADAFKLLAAVFLAMLGLAHQAAATGSERTEQHLSWPSALRAQESIESPLSGIAVTPDTLYTLSSAKQLIISGPFAANAGDRLGVFGEITAQRRWPRLPGSELSAWRALIDQGRRLLVFDGGTMAFYEIEKAKGSVVVQRTLVWDQVRPPRDRGGEATRSETAELRAKVRKAYMLSPKLKIAGIAAVPAAWFGLSKVSTYLAALRWPGVPIGLIECELEEPSRCQLSRICSLGPGPRPDAAHFEGIAVSVAKRQLLLADGKDKTLSRYRFDSCYASSFLGISRLPDKIKSLTNVFVDSQERLWVTAGAPDNYLNASVYAWDEGLW